MWAKFQVRTIISLEIWTRKKKEKKKNFMTILKATSEEVDQKYSTITQKWYISSIFDFAVIFLVKNVDMYDYFICDIFR